MGSPSARLELEALLEQATPIPAEQTPADLITMNSTVVLVDARTKDRTSYTVVYPEDYEIPGSTHVLEPLGQSVLGRREGAPVEVPETGEHFRIASLLYQPEAAGNVAQ
jgi:regulator of nucleoside diphosphate kinase